MKIEIQNKQLEEDLDNLASAEYIPTDRFIAKILKEYVEANSTILLEKQNTDLAYIKKEADKIITELNIKLFNFEQRYDVETTISESSNVSEKYKIKVVL